MSLAEEREEKVEKQALEQLKQQLYEDYGLYFPSDKLYSLRRKLRRRYRQLGLDSIKEYKDHLEANRTELQAFLDIVSTNKTGFFRELDHWKFLQKNIIPDRERGRRMKVWSTACSTGEEVYTAALLLDKYLAGRDGYKILGTDLSGAVVQRAMKGIYKNKQLEPVFDYFDYNIQHVFEKIGDDRFRVKDKIKNHLTFRQFNLKKKCYPFRNDFDLILCRNVFMYFDKQMIKHTVDQLTKCLRRGGYLFIGHTENLSKIDHDLKKVKPATFKLPGGGR